MSLKLEKLGSGFNHMSRGRIISHVAAGDGHSYEDFTDYTKVDPENNFTIGSTKCLATDMHTEHVIAYIYKDYEAGHFESGTEIQFEFNFDSIVGAGVNDWFGLVALTNTPSEAVNMGNSILSYGEYKDATYVEKGIYATSYAVLFSTNKVEWGTTYYATLTFTYGDPSTIEEKIYSDSDRTNLLVTLTRNDIPAANIDENFRYLVVCPSKRDNNDNTPVGTFFVQNLEIISVTGA